LTRGGHGRRTQTMAVTSSHAEPTVATLQRYVL